MALELLEELDPPDGVNEAEEAVEVLRAWIADGALLVSINSPAFAEHVEDWGRLLAEVGHHVAKAAALNGYLREEEGLAALRSGFLSVFGSVSPEASGRLRGGPKH